MPYTPENGVSDVSNYEVLHGDALEILRGMPDESVDAVVTDPPYGLSQHKPAVITDTLARWTNGDTEYTPPAKGGFMGKTWDSFVPPPAVWAECMRVLKPGGHLVAFAGTRTQDLMGMSVRLAGFEIRDGIGWIYGSGFPKSLDVSKAIDKAAGAEREIVGTGVSGKAYSMGGLRGVETSTGEYDITAPATPEAEQWAGWGTALKPAIEPVVVARKPLDGTVAANVLAHGTGALNIDACRVGGDTRLNSPAGSLGNGVNMSGGPAQAGRESTVVVGRFPANVLLDEHAAAAMDEQSGITRSNVRAPTGKDTRGIPNTESQTVVRMNDTQERGVADSGGASRFFPVFKYQAKAPKSERPGVGGVKHPTVKPLELMRWLVRLVAPPGGVVLDPFAGSGTTGEAAYLEGFDSILIEGSADYVPLIHERYRRSSTPDTKEA